MIANSNSWYNLWVNDPYIKENMTLTFTLLRNNTTEGLWNKCLEDYEEYALEQRGGPLMFFLIMSRIQRSNETAMEHLKTQIRNLKVRDIPGEDVEKVVSLIKTTHNTLLNASTPEHNYVPDDFPHIVLKVLQTSTVGPFNAAMKHEVTLVKHEQHKYGGRPQWPSISEILGLAVNTYRDLVADDHWHTTSRQRSRALIADGQTSSSGGGGGDTTNRPKITSLCWNCGDQSHTAHDCPKPLNSAQVAKGFKKYNELREKHGTDPLPDSVLQGVLNRPNRHSRRPFGQKSRKPKRKMGAGGVPMIRNRHGSYVADQQRINEQKERKEAQQEMENTLSAMEREMQVNVATQTRSHGSGTQSQLAMLQSCKEAMRKFTA